MSWGCLLNAMYGSGGWYFQQQRKKVELEKERERLSKLEQDNAAR